MSKFHAPRAMLSTSSKSSLVEDCSRGRTIVKNSKYDHFQSPESRLQGRRPQCILNHFGALLFMDPRGDDQGRTVARGTHPVETSAVG